VGGGTALEIVNNALELNVDTSKALYVDASNALGIKVNTMGGLEIANGALKTKLAQGTPLQYNTGGDITMLVDNSSGLNVDSNDNLFLDIDGASPLNINQYNQLTLEIEDGLKIDNRKLSVALEDDGAIVFGTNYGLSLSYDHNLLEVDENNELTIKGIVLEGVKSLNGLKEDITLVGHGTGCIGLNVSVDSTNNELLLDADISIGDGLQDTNNELSLLVDANQFTFNQKHELTFSGSFSGVSKITNEQDNKSFTGEVKFDADPNVNSCISTK
jgi:hypothetical protein